jgi:hypothetical protein
MTIRKDVEMTSELAEMEQQKTEKRAGKSK